MKFQQTFVTAPATVRPFFHDCFVRGCDASVMLASRNSSIEKDNPINLSLAGDGFDTVIKAKATVDIVPGCQNKVSCADILALAARDFHKSSRHIVTLFASNSTAFETSFVSAMTKLGRIGVKTGSQGDIRRDCAIVN